MQLGIEIPTTATSRAADDALKALRPLVDAVDLEVIPVDFHARRELSVTLPRQAVNLLLEVLGQLAHGNSVTIVPVHAELTTQQAAELLNVSRPFLIGLLEDQKIPYIMVGSHRRVRASDLMAYKNERDMRTRDAAKALAAIGQDIGT